MMFSFSGFRALGGVGGRFGLRGFGIPGLQGVSGGLGFRVWRLRNGLGVDFNSHQNYKLGSCLKRRKEETKPKPEALN